mmetsp:Transcript_24283/g.27748  ORF Transcript_24283/g.27748 Transcript_24283/m.27748 type:complete len:208 (-) Transcript_24283:696-1319(-)
MSKSDNNPPKLECCCFYCEKNVSDTEYFSYNASLISSDVFNLIVRSGYPLLLSLPSNHTFAFLSMNGDGFCSSFVSVAHTLSFFDKVSENISFHVEISFTDSFFPLSSILLLTVAPNGTSFGGSSTHVLNRITLRPQSSSGVYSGAPFTNDLNHKSVGRGTACNISPRKRNNLPLTTGTVTSFTFPSLLSISPPLDWFGNTQVGPCT